MGEGDRPLPVEERMICHEDLDAAASGRPVLVLEQSLVELARRVTGEFRAEVDGARTFQVGEMLLAVRDQFLFQQTSLIVARRQGRLCSRC